MKTIISWVTRIGEFMAAVMMAAMFATFILQIFIRYSARLEWLPDVVPALEPSRFGWTLEFCLLMWVWIVFMGNSLIVRERDHVTFDILYTHVNPTVRKWFAIISGVAICVGLLWSFLPTWEKFYILRLKQTATLKQLVGDWVRMRDVYSVYFVFLAIVALRYAWRARNAFRHGAEADLHHYQDMAEEMSDEYQGAGKE